MKIIKNSLIIIFVLSLFACNSGTNADINNSNGNNIIQGDSNTIIVIHEKLKNIYCKQIEDIIQLSKGNLLCHQTIKGETVSLTFKGKENFYPLAEYNANNIPQVSNLANLVSNIYHSFDTLYKEPDYYIDMFIFATSDGHKMDSPILYHGKNVDCDCFTPTITTSSIIHLINGNLQVNNKTLGCARAGAFYSKLVENGVNPSVVKLNGKELILKGGEYRYIEITINFNNVLKYNPKFEICDICKNL